MKKISELKSQLDELQMKLYQDMFGIPEIHTEKEECSQCGRKVKLFPFSGYLVPNGWFYDMQLCKICFQTLPTTQKDLHRQTQDYLLKCQELAMRFVQQETLELSVRETVKFYEAIFFGESKKLKVTLEHINPK